MVSQVVIKDYDAEWPSLYERERERILAAIGEWVAAIEHVGSTSVVGLGAKPIIDIMVGLRSLADAAHCIEPLARLGYEYVPQHEAVMPERRYFSRGPKSSRTHHLHMVEMTSEFWRTHLLFRDYLRAHPQAAREYDLLKRQLARTHRTDRGAYTDAKAPFIESILRRAREAAEG